MLGEPSRGDLISSARASNDSHRAGCHRARRRRVWRPPSVKAAAESVVVERVVAAAACAYLGDGGLLVANGGLSRLLPLPPLERVEAAEGVLRLCTRRVRGRRRCACCCCRHRSSASRRQAACGGFTRQARCCRSRACHCRRYSSASRRRAAYCAVERMEAADGSMRRRAVGSELLLLSLLSLPPPLERIEAADAATERAVAAAAAGAH